MSNSIKLIWLKEFNDVLLLLWSYMFIYNVSLFVVFSTVIQLLNSKIKTLYAFSDLGSTNTFTKILVVALFSMAGVPPFWGFFSKIFIFLLLFNSNLYIFYIFFTIVFISYLFLKSYPCDVVITIFNFVYDCTNCFRVFYTLLFYRFDNTILFVRSKYFVYFVMFITYG